MFVYFSDSEASNLDWMFMGGHGTGADMHIDSVDRPSWQVLQVIFFCSFYKYERN